MYQFYRAGLILCAAISTLSASVIQRLGHLGQIRQEEQYLEQLELLANDVEARLTNLSTITLMTAEHLSGLLESGNIYTIKPEFLQRVKQVMPKLRTTLIVNADGIVFEDMREGQPALNVDVSDREYFHTHLEQETEGVLVFAPVVSRIDGEWTWVLSAAVRDQKNNLLAVVVTSLDRRFFSGLFSSLHHLDYGFGLMIHADGHLLEASPSQQDRIGQSFSDRLPTLAEAEKSIHRDYVWSSSHNASNLDSGTVLHKPVTNWQIHLLVFLDEKTIHHAQRQSIGGTPYWVLVLLLAILVSTILHYQNIGKRLKMGRQLWLSQQKLLEAQYLAKAGDFTWEIETNHVRWSPGIYRLLGYDPQETISFELVAENIHHPDDHKFVMQWINEGLQTQKTKLEPREYRLLNKFGDTVHVLTNIRINYEQGQAKSVFGTIVDITQRIKDERQIRQQQRKMSLLLETTGSGILSVDENGICTSCNPAALQMLGYSREEELLGTNLPRVLQGELSDDSENSPIRRVLQSCEPCQTNQEYFVRRNGDRFPVQVHVNPIVNGDRAEGAVLSFSDISQQKQLEERLYQQAHHDSLTALPNRVLLLDRLKQAILTAKRQGDLVGVIFLDLDDFKNINDSLGHDVGDRLLQKIASRLTKIVRGNDTVARMGGDEFVIVLNHIEKTADASIVARKLLSQISEPISLPEGQLRINASLGISIYPTDGQDVETLLKAADTALYRAKEEGRGGYQYFAPAFALEADQMHEIEQKLSQAQTHGHFALAYQPIVDSQTGELKAIEALFRFQRLPKYENISIFKAIQIAERNGSIIEIGKWVLQTAITDAIALSNRLGKRILLHYNSSSRQFLNDGFVEELSAQLRATQFPPQDLILEITESSLLRSPARAEEVARNLVEMGVTIALDDFGTGYSSLSYLARFPVSIMKIDKSFIRNIQPGTKKEIILKSMIDFGKNLGIIVLCEGIETKHQHTMMTGFGCEQMQGFLYSRGIHIDEILPVYPI